MTNVSIDGLVVPEHLVTVLLTSRASFKPFKPVHALAQPELIKIPKNCLSGC